MALTENKNKIGLKIRTFPFYDDKALLVMAHDTKSEYFAATVPMNRKIRDVVLMNYISKQTGISMNDLHNPELKT